MKKNILLGLLAALVLTFAGCDLNLFNNFEDIPSFTPQEMNESISEIGEEDDDGDVVITGTLAVNGGKDDDPNTEPEPPEVQSAAKTYIDNVTVMVENDTIKDYGDKEAIEKVAKNLDTIVTAILDKAEVDIESEAAEGLTFERLILGTGVTEEKIAENKEKLDELREIVQKSASASVDIRLAADPEAKSLISDTMLMLLDMLNNEDDSSRSARTLTYGTENGTETYDNLSGNIQIRLGDSESPDYILFAKNTNPENDTNEVEFGFEVFDGNENYDAEVFVENSTVGPAYILPWSDILDENDADIVEFLGLINDALADGSFGVPSLEARLDLIDSLLSDGSDDMSPAELFDTVNEYIDLSKIKSLTNTFNGIAGSARGFASTLDYTSGGDKIDLTKVSAQFKGSTGGSLNGKGTDMATMSILSILFDYLFDTDADADDDERGILNVDAFDKFMNTDDMVSSTIMNEGDPDEYMEATIDYVAELIPDYYTVEIDSESKTIRDHFLAELDVSLLTEHMFKWANMAEDGDSGLVLTRMMERDAARIEKLATLLNMRHFYVDEGAGIDNFTALLEDMIQDDEGE